MIDIRHCDFVYVIGYDDNAGGELVRSQVHYVDLHYAFTVALSVLDVCDHVLIFSDNDSVPYIMTSFSEAPAGTIIINRKE